MTDLDTTPPVVMALASRHPTAGRAPGVATTAAPGDDVDDGDHQDHQSEAARAQILPLNDAAAVYEALAAQIAGTAVGWSDTALAKLEQGLLQRYGPIVGGRQPIRRLVRLAAQPLVA